MYYGLVIFHYFLLLDDFILIIVTRQIVLFRYCVYLDIPLLTLNFPLWISIHLYMSLVADVLTSQFYSFHVIEIGGITSTKFIKKVIISKHRTIYSKKHQKHLNRTKKINKVTIDFVWDENNMASKCFRHKEKITQSKTQISITKKFSWLQNNNRI